MPVTFERKDEPEVARYQIQNALWWIGATGIDGIRQDTVQYLPRFFIRDLNAALDRRWPALQALAGTAHANDVFEVCKGESKPAVAGKGKISIAVVYPHMTSLGGDAFWLIWSEADGRIEIRLSTRDERSLQGTELVRLLRQGQVDISNVALTFRSIGARRAWFDAIEMSRPTNSDWSWPNSARVNGPNASDATISGMTMKKLKTPM